MSARTITGEVGVYLPSYSSVTPEDLVSADDAMLIKRIQFSALDMTPEWARIGTATVTVTLATTESIVQGQVATLKAQQRKVKGDAEAEVTKLERQIQSLLAITHEVGA